MSHLSGSRFGPRRKPFVGQDPLYGQVSGVVHNVTFDDGDPAFPSTPVLDSFNAGANQNLTARTGWAASSIWTGDTGYTTDAVPTEAKALGSSFTDNYWNTQFTDVDAYTTVATAQTGYFDVYARITAVGSPTMYATGIDASGNWFLTRYATGTATVMASIGALGLLGAGDSVGIRCYGTRISAWYKPSGGAWTKVGEVTDATIAGPGYIGLDSGGTTTAIDSFGGGALVPVGSVDTFAPYAVTPRPFYGPELLNEGLFNLQIGPNGWMLDYKEKLEHGGVLDSISVYVVATGAYAGGTGGSLRCRVETDSGGIPSGTLVSAGATATVTTPLGTSAVYTFDFTTPPTVTKGQLVHFVFDNPDASPTVNFVSIDNIDVSGYNQLPQPTIPDSDRFVNYFDSGAWIPGNPYYYPIFRTLYADGYKGGQSYYESGNPHYVGGSAKIHQLITPTRTISVSALMVAVAKYTSTTNDLVVKLIDVTGGNTVLASTNIPASAIHLGDNSRYGERHVPWAFGTSFTLNAGDVYAVELSSAETVNPYLSTSTRFGGIPASFGANFDSYYRTLDMLYEYSTDGGTTWLQDTGQSQMQMFFTVTGIVHNVSMTSAGSSAGDTIIPGRLRAASFTSAGAGSGDTFVPARRRSAAFTSTGSGTDAFVTARRRAALMTSAGVSTDTFVRSQIHAGAMTSTGSGTDTYSPNRARTASMTSTGIATTAFARSQIHAASFSSTGAGTDTISPARRRAASFTSTGSGTDTYSAHRARNASFTSTGSGTDSAAPARIRAASFTSTGAGTDTYTTARRRAAAFTSTGSGTDTYTPNRARTASFTSTGSGTDTFTTARRRAASLTSMGSGTDALTPARLRGVSFTSTGVGTDTFIPIRDRDVMFLSIGSGTDTFTATRIRAATATSTGVGTDVMAGGRVRQATMTSAGSGTDSAIPSRVKAASMTSAGSATDTYSPNRARTASFTSAGAATDAFTTARRRAASFTSTGSGADSFAAARRRAASVTSAGSGTDTCSPNRFRTRTLTSNGVGTDAATVARIRAAQMTSAGSGADTYASGAIRAASFMSTGVGTDVYSTGHIKLASFTSAGSGTDTAIPARRRAASFTSTGAATDTFAVARKRAGTFTSTGSGTDTFAVARRRAAALTSAGVGTDAMAVGRIREASFTSAGVSSDSGVPQTIVSYVFDAGTVTIGISSSGAEAVADAGTTPIVVMPAGTQATADAGTSNIAITPSHADAVADQGTAAVQIASGGLVSVADQGEVDIGVSTGAGAEIVSDAGTQVFGIDGSGDEAVSDAGVTPVVITPSGDGEVGSAGEVRDGGTAIISISGGGFVSGPPSDGTSGPRIVAITSTPSVGPASGRPEDGIESTDPTIDGANSGARRVTGVTIE